MRSDSFALPWGISLAVHGLLLLVLAVALGPGHGHRQAVPGPPPRLVWVEPAPPAAPPLGAGPARERDAAAPERDTAAARDDRVPAPPATARRAGEGARPSAPRLVARRPPSADVPGEVEPEAAAALADRSSRTGAEPAARAADPPAPETATAGGSAAGVAGGRGDTVAGTADGLAGGVVGGRGETPLALRDVAAPPALVHRVLPEYPRQARALGVEGQVVLEVVLDRAGRIEDEVRVLRSIRLLDAAAIAAVKQWRFRPARDPAGRPVRVVMEIPVRFELR